MAPAMQGLIIALVCLACASYGRRLQTPLRNAGNDGTPNPLKAFAALLEVSKPAIGFNLSPATLALGQSHAASSALSNRARSPNMQYSGGSPWNREPAWKTLASAPDTAATAKKNEEDAALVTTAAIAEEIKVPEAVDASNALAAEEAPAAKKAPASEKMKESKREPTPTGIFAPAVLAAKRVMGEKELLEFRAGIIRQHTKVINGFVDTSDSKFGQLVLEKMFQVADADDNGTLDNQEIRDALDKLGFTFLKDKEVDRLIKKADADKNEVVDLDEFKKETPKMLRVNLVKLAKSNGHDLGFLA